jgi:hypothetical protein
MKISLLDTSPTEAGGVDSFVLRIVAMHALACHQWEALYRVGGPRALPRTAAYTARTRMAAPRTAAMAAPRTIRQPANATPLSSDTNALRFLQ